MTEIRVNEKYRLGRKIGSGSFGSIHIAVNVQTNEEVAVKLEPLYESHNQLQTESKVLRILKDTPGIPHIYWFGEECQYNVLIMELLGPSLEDLFNFCNRKLTLQTVLLILDAIIIRLEAIHSKNFVHRDVKPANFLIGQGTNWDMIYVIDFGLSQRYKDQKTLQHIPMKENKRMVGTARYASINAHLGYDQSRRDDIESLAYNILYYLKGSLPWQGIQATMKKEKYQAILDAKTNTPPEDLCQDLPPEFLNLIKYARGLRFEEKPDYASLRRQFKDLYTRLDFENEWIFDWTLAGYGSARNFHQRPIRYENKKTQQKKQNLSQIIKSNSAAAEKKPPKVSKPAQKKKNQKCTIF